MYLELQLVCALPALQTAEGAALWGQLLGGLLKALEQRRLEQENGVGEAPENHEDVAEENQVICIFLLCSCMPGPSAAISNFLLDGL